MNNLDEGTVPGVIVITPTCLLESLVGSPTLTEAIDFYTHKEEFGACCCDGRAMKCKSFKGFSYCFLLAGVSPLKSETLWIIKA